MQQYEGASRFSEIEAKDWATKAVVRYGDGNNPDSIGMDIEHQSGEMWSGSLIKNEQGIYAGDFSTRDGASRAFANGRLLDYGNKLLFFGSWKEGATSYYWWVILE